MAPTNIIANTNTNGTARPLPPTGKKIRLGTASPATQATTPETLDRLERIVHQASEQKIDILLLPEAYIGGYPRGTHFGCVIGNRSNEGRDEYLAYFQNAVDLGDIVGDGAAGGGDAWVKRELPGDDLSGGGGDENGTNISNGNGVVGEKTKPRRGDGTREELERIARQTGVFLVVGCIEKAGGSMYCSAVYVCPARGIIGKRRKVMPTGTERLVWAQGSPATLRAVSTTIRGVRINMAAAICWENYMPLLRQSIYAQNINLYLAPTADGRDAWLSLLRTIGIEGRCFVVCSNMCVRDNTPSSNPPAPVQVQIQTPIFQHTDHQPHQPHQHQHQHHQPQTNPTQTQNRRRTSCVTEDGFEIALPPSPTQLHHPIPNPSRPAAARPSTSSKRRTSVFDEDGNEIVLCCRDDNSEHNNNNVNDGNGEDNSSAVIIEGSSSSSPTRISSPTATSATATTSAPPTWAKPPNTNTNTNTKTAPPNPPPKPQNVNISNGHATKTSSSSSHNQNKNQKFTSRGGSSIISPFGDILAGPQWEDDTNLIYTDVEFDDCIRGRLDLDAAGSYSRNDSFKFSVQGLNMIPLPY